MHEIDGVIVDEAEVMFDILHEVDEVVEVEHDEVEVDEKFYLFDQLQV
jgi:hypothetical protein